MIDTLIAAIGLAVTITLALAGLVAYRRAELRRDQVSEWAGRAIESLQTLALLIKPDLLETKRSEIEMRVQQIGIQLSVLTEQGRLFFRNQPANGYGAKKLPAYRGVRPLILDELIIAHQLAMAWSKLATSDQEFAFQTAVVSLKRFVSLVQHEVGRERTASTYTDVHGDGTTFRILLTNYRTGTEYPRVEIAGKPNNPSWIDQLRRLFA